MIHCLVHGSVSLESAFNYHCDSCWCVNGSARALGIRICIAFPERLLRMTMVYTKCKIRNLTRDSKSIAPGYQAFSGPGGR